MAIDLLLKDYLLAGSIVLYTSVLSGIFLCKLSYEITRFVSVSYFKGYSSLTKMRCIEWNNRGMSSVHAIFISIMSLYIVFVSGMFSDNHPEEPLVMFRSSNLSTFTLGVSVGYFITDISMIFWLYPSLGGMEYIFHHLLSLTAMVYAMFSGEAQLYTFMILISETTTPGINLRWYLDIAGLKKSQLYVINGIGMFLVWLVARIFLFIYLFYHIYAHYEQIKLMHKAGFILTFSVPTSLAAMNVMWFSKILKGLLKTLSKRQ